ncbi:SURF1 family protein [Guyparkeria sp. 1SP6A2]|nr:SURF1 family protein [Guyparkeria sp. 1SP6A2]
MNGIATPETYGNPASQGANMAMAKDNRTADLPDGASSVTKATPRGRRFRPALAQTLATLILLPVFLGLSLWQVQRAAEKQHLFEAESAARQALPVPVESLGPTDVPLHARAAGRYDEHLFLLDNRVRDRRAGYEVLAPLRIADDEAVLVNLGWVAQGASREQLPAVEVPTGTVDVTGLAMTPEPPPFELSDRETFAGGWPKVVQTAVPGILERKLGYPLRPVVLYPDGSEVAAHKVKVMHDFGPARHHGYAAQWFGFAVVLVIVYLWHGLHRGRQRRNEEWTQQ